MMAACGFFPSFGWAAWVFSLMRAGACAALVLGPLWFTPVMASAAENWPDFRGPEGNGHSDARGLPLTWSETQNVVWKTPIPGRGWSSPVIWGDQIWMTTATAKGRELFAVAVDKGTGKIVHSVKVFDVEQPDDIDPTNSYASPSPVIEQGRVYVHFGAYGTACLATDSAAIIWQRRDFPVDHKLGPGSSPVLFEDLLIFQCDGNDVQYMVALHKGTGETAWRTDRSVDLSGRGADYRKSFSTPLVLRFRGETQVVSTAAGAVFAYEPTGGRELWQVRYPGHTNVSRPVADQEMVVINTGYPKPEVWGVRLGGGGNLTDTHVAWKLTQNAPTKPSVILSDGLLYMVTDSGGVASCLDAPTGRIVWRHRLGGNYAASLLMAEDRLYFFSTEGKTTVIEKTGRSYRELAVNHLPEGLMASPAVSGSALFLRTRGRLYRIQQQSD